MDIRKVPRMFQDCTMADLLAGKLRSRFRVSKTFYHTLITLIRERSAYCMLLTGPAGCGKTTLMHALYDKSASDLGERHC
jgi:ABC-type lipoprotein export system ATPase subunit